MSEKDLKQQIEYLDKKLRDEQLAWNEKLREKEKENFILSQEYNQAKVEQDNEIARLKREIFHIRHEKEEQVLKNSEEYNTRIRSKEKKIEELLYEKEQLKQKSALELKNKQALHEQKINDLQKTRDEQEKELKEYKKGNTELEEQLREAKRFYEHEQSILEAKYEKEKAVLNEEYRFKTEELEDNTALLGNKLTSLEGKLSDKEIDLERGQKIREAETNAVREENIQKINHLSNMLEEATRQRDFYIRELEDNTGALKDEIAEERNENEFLHSKLVLREEELSREIQDKNDIIRNLNEEIPYLQNTHSEKIVDMEKVWSAQKSGYLKDVDSLNVEIERLKLELSGLGELREAEGDRLRKRLEDLDGDYNVRLAEMEIEHEENENAYNERITELEKQLEETENNLQLAESDKEKLTDDVKKRLSDKQDEIDELKRAIDNLSADKEEDLARKTAEFERKEQKLNARIEDLEGSWKEERNRLEEKLENLVSEKHKIELEKGRKIETLLQELKSKKEEEEKSRKIAIEREAEWNKRVLEIKQEKELTEEEKNIKAEQLEKLKERLGQEISEMAGQLEAKREHWEWLISQKQTEINKVRERSREEIIRLKEEYSKKELQLDATRAGLENAVRELSDRMEKERADKYSQLKQKDETIRDLEIQYETEKIKIKEKYELEFGALGERQDSLLQNTRELEEKLKLRQEVWDEKLALKERESEQIRQKMKDREEELYSMWKEKQKSSGQKILELSRQIEEIKSKNKQQEETFKHELEAQMKSGWENELKGVKKSKEIELDYSSRLDEAERDKDKLENEISILREQLNTERINAFRKLREREDEIKGIKEEALSESEGIYRRYTEKSVQLEEVKSALNILSTEKDTEIKQLSRNLEAEKEEKENMARAIELTEKEYKRIIEQKQEDFTRERNILLTELEKLKIRQDELISELKEMEQEKAAEINKLKEENALKEKQLIEDFRIKEHEIVVKKAELEDELSRTVMELGAAKKQLDLKESEVRREVSGEYENKIYKLKLDEALSRSELEWTKEKLASERERGLSEINETRKENSELKKEVSARIKELETDYSERLKQIDEKRAVLEREKEEHRDRMEVLRVSHQKKVDTLYDEVQQQRAEYETRIKEVRHRYAEADKEASLVRHTLELKIQELNSQVGISSRDNQEILAELSEYRLKYDNTCRQMQEENLEYSNKIRELNFKIDNINAELAASVRDAELRSEREKKELQARYLQNERNLRVQIEEKRHKLVARENEINNIKSELKRVNETMSLDVKTARERMEKWHEKETELKEKIEALQQQLYSTERSALESDLKAENTAKSMEFEKARLKEEIRRAKADYLDELRTVQARLDSSIAGEYQLKQQMEILNGKYSDAERKAAQAEIKTEALNTRRETEINSIVEESERIKTGLAAELESAAARLNKWDEKGQLLENKISDLQERLILSRAEAAEAQLKTESLQKKYEYEIDSLRDEYRKERNSMLAELEVSSEKISGWSEKESKLKEDIEKMQKALQEAESKANTMQIEYSNAVGNFESDIRRLKTELKEVQIKHAEEMKTARILREKAELIQQKLNESENSLLQADLRNESIKRDKDAEIVHLNKEIERIQQGHAAEIGLYKGDRDRLNEEINDIRENKNILQEMVSVKEKQFEKLNNENLSIRKDAEQRFAEKQAEINKIRENNAVREKEWESKILEKERELSVSFERKSSERESYWQDIYSSREKELLEFRNRLQEEIDQLKKEKLSSDRIWDMRLKEKEEELKDIQLEKAQNESRLKTLLARMQKELNEYKARFKNAREVLREREGQNRELRARMAQRDIQWKTAYKKKQIEAKKLIFEVQQSQRGLLKKITDSVTGAGKRKKEMFQIELEHEKDSAGISNI
ncbi:MAG: hypothetical protein ABIH89_00555 [Elusimicrobiota bacterium]